MTATNATNKQPGDARAIAVLDVQRLRRDALAAALALSGLPAVSCETPPAGATLLVLHEDWADREGRRAGSAPYLLIASTHLRAGLTRSWRTQALAVMPAASSVDALAAAVTDVLAGVRPVFAVRETSASMDRSLTTRVRSLSARERLILNQVAAGLGNEEIGKVLGITKNTVRTHVQNIFSKLDVANRGAAVATARRAGLPLDLEQVP